MISYEELIADPRTDFARDRRFRRRGCRRPRHRPGGRRGARSAREPLQRRRRRARREAAARILRDLVRLFDFYPEAADDPYVKGVRAQAAAALEGRSAPPLGRVAIRPAEPAPAAAERPRRMSQLLAFVRRHGYQITLIAAGILYWLWPNDLIPDDEPFGRVDDASFLIILSFLAGRVSKRTPGAARPAEVSFALRRPPATRFYRPPGRRRASRPRPAALAERSANRPVAPPYRPMLGNPRLRGGGGFVWRAAGNDRSVRKLTRNRSAPQGAGSGGLLVKRATNWLSSRTP